MPPDRLPNTASKEHTLTTHVLRVRSPYELLLQLEGTVPDCAQQCLTNYISLEYQCSQHGISCLCQEYSSHGFTLGELAYICVDRDCKSASRSELLSQYNICSTVSDAVTATHSVLTPPAATPSKSSTSTTNRITPSLQTTSAANRSLASNTKSGLAATATAAATSASPSSVHSSHISAPLAVGISIAVLAVTILIIAAIYFFICFRRRKTSYVDGEKVRDSTDKPAPRLSSTLAIQPAEKVRRFERDAVKYWQQLATVPAQQGEQNLDTSPQSVESYGSARTQSHLLPNKSVAIPSLQQQKVRSDSADTAATEFEEEKPVVGPIWKGIGLPSSPQASLDPANKTRRPQKRPPAANKTIISPDHRHIPSLSLTIPTSAARLPKIQPPAPVARPPLLTPREESRGNEQRKSSASRSRSRDSSVSFLNYYASSEAGVSETPVLVDSPTAMETQIPKLPVPSSIVITRPPDPRTVTRKNSAASDTSFESSDGDEPTPPEGDKQLTPVQESPVAQRSPISDIRYPKIPRSANQTVPRSPGYSNLSPGSLQLPSHPQHRYEYQQTYHPYSPKQIHQQDWPLQSKVTPERQISTKLTRSGSTLAAKRRGETAAHDLELNLNSGVTSNTPFHKVKPSSQHEDRYRSRKDPNCHRQESPLRGYGRVASGGRTASHDRHHSRGRSPRHDGQQDRPLKSPIWEPKLTPEKRGDDLYLQVGVATPMQANFRQ